MADDACASIAAGCAIRCHWWPVGPLVRRPKCWERLAGVLESCCISLVAKSDAPLKYAFQTVEALCMRYNDLVRMWRESRLTKKNKRIEGRQGMDISPKRQPSHR